MLTRDLRDSSESAICISNCRFPMLAGVNDPGSRMNAGKTLFALVMESGRRRRSEVQRDHLGHLPFPHHRNGEQGHSADDGSGSCAPARKVTT